MSIKTVSSMIHPKSDKQNSPPTTQYLDKYWFTWPMTVNENKENLHTNQPRKSTSISCKLWSASSKTTTKMHYVSLKRSRTTSKNMPLLRRASRMMKLDRWHVSRRCSSAGVSCPAPRNPGRWNRRQFLHLLLSLNLLGLSLRLKVTYQFFFAM